MSHGTHKRFTQSLQSEIDSFFGKGGTVTKVAPTKRTMRPKDLEYAVRGITPPVTSEIERRPRHTLTLRV